jgi:hypothetical protein
MACDRGDRMATQRSDLGIVALFWGARVTLNLPDELYSLVGATQNLLFDLVINSRTNTGRNILRVEIVHPNGSTVGVIVVAVQLEGVYDSWQELN